MAQFDEDEEIVEEAQQQWEEKNMKLIPSFSIPLFLLLGHAEAKTRACAARAIAAGLEQFPAAVKGVLEVLGLYAYEGSDRVAMGVGEARGREA